MGDEFRILVNHQTQIPAHAPPPTSPDGVLGERWQGDIMNAGRSAFFRLPVELFDGGRSRHCFSALVGTSFSGLLSEEKSDIRERL
jgi:hypothetical protein